MAMNATTKSTSADTSTRIVVTKLNNDIMVSDTDFAELANSYELDTDRIPSVVEDENIETNYPMPSHLTFGYDKDSLEELEEFLGENRERRRNSFLTVGVIWDTGRMLGGSRENLDDFGFCDELMETDHHLIVDGDENNVNLIESEDIFQFLDDEDESEEGRYNPYHLDPLNISKNVQRAITVKSLHEMIGGWTENSDSETLEDMFWDSVPAPLDSARTSACPLHLHRKCSTIGYDYCSSIDCVSNKSPVGPFDIKRRRSSTIILPNRDVVGGDENVSEYSSHEVLMNAGHAAFDEKYEDILGEINQLYRDQLAQLNTPTQPADDIESLSEQVLSIS